MASQLVLYAALVVLAVVVIGGYAVLRRRADRPLPDAAAASPPPAAGTAMPPPVSPAPPPLQSTPFPMRAVMHQLYALAFHDATLEDTETRVQDAHARVLAECSAILDHIEDQPAYTPRRPLLLPKLIQAVNDNQSSGRDIATLIGQDPALAGNLLRIANSPLYRLQALPVESLERAVTLVGTDGLRQMIATAMMQPVLNMGGGVYGRFPSIVWDHSLLSSTAAVEHARSIEHGDVFAAQLLGLLHGLGAVIVVQVARDQYARHPELAPQPAVATALLDTRTSPTARRIAASWEMSSRVLGALDEQVSNKSQTAISPLGRSLRYGRVAGAVSLLVRHEHMAEATALEWLDRLEPDPQVNLAVWQRLSAANRG